MLSRQSFKLAAALFLGAASLSQAQVSPLLVFDRSPEEIARHCRDAQSQASMALAIIATSQPNFSNTAVALDRDIYDLLDRTASDVFLKDVAVSSSVREASLECSTNIDKFLIDVFTREDLFKPLNALSENPPKLKGEDARLLDKEMLDFKRNGLLLSAEDRAELKKMRKTIVELEEKFQKNLVEVNDALWLSTAQLDGLPADFIKRLPKKDGLSRVGVDYPDFFPFMENAKDEGARRQLLTLFDNRAAAENIPVLSDALALRRKAALLLGYKSHSAYVLEDRMAKNPQTVERFLSRLARRLKPMAKKELKAMVSLKNAELGEKSDHVIHSWDWRYYDNQLRKKLYNVDNEEIKAYFPAQTVIDGMLRVYQSLLGLNFKKIEDAKTWNPDVPLYEIADPENGTTIGYFYMDLFPREGKYKHAASYDLIRGRKLADGSYQPPVAAIVANFSKPTPDRPSLLKHGEHEEVETFFHEFGHIMHQTLTRAKYGRFAGSNVDQDFVEAPSQMLENWVWDPQILQSLSGRYDNPDKKLPDALLKRMIASKNLDSGLKTLRQLLFASVDLAYHAGPLINYRTPEWPPSDWPPTPGRPSVLVDKTTEVWGRLAKDISLIPMAEGTHPEASFGHIMGGYDAGYYGYLWSKVYAQDMFTRFKKEGLLNPAIGKRYRQAILEPGGSRDPSELLKNFLGREPDETAFLQSLGLKK